MHRAIRLRSLVTSGLILCATALSAEAQIKPVPLPNPGIPGFVFPEREATVLEWIAKADKADPAASAQIALHGWGLWTALTAETDQSIDGQKLRVFETWLTPGDITSTPGPRSMALLAAKPRGRSPLQPLRQFRHKAPGKKTTSAVAAAAPLASRVTGFVKYDPTASEHIVSQGLLTKSTLDSLLANGSNALPPFGNTAVSLKPVFRTITKADLKQGRYFPLPVWTGPPTPAVPYPSTDWPAMVWIDVQGGGSGKGDVDLKAKANPDGSTRTDAATYPVSSMIHYRLNAADAKAAGGGAAAGDYAVLLAMHVTSKEITRWTWQTFWWTPNPEVAYAPSDKGVVAARPARLQGAPRNYAMGIGYEMESPSQPNVGGTNAGNSIYVYNPWLEAGFGPSDLPDSIPGTDQGKPAPNNVGVQTNCMSCHGAANYNPNGVSTAPDYSGDRYVDLVDPRFKGTLTVDFLWSLPQNAK